MWTNGQAPSERLAAQILLSDGFIELDPSHPLGGKDNGKDGLCFKHGQQWIMAVHFPRGQQEFGTIKSKFRGDLTGVARNGASAMAFVTNQELRLAERKELQELAAPIDVQIYHLERLTTILDSPKMSKVRHQFLGIEPSDTSALYLKRLAAGDRLWAAVVEFRKRTPPVTVALDFVTSEEEETLNQNSTINAGLRTLSEDQFPNWSEGLDAAEKDRHLIGEDLWLLVWYTRAIFMRIVHVLIRERGKRRMKRWRDDPGISQLLGYVCSPAEIGHVQSLQVGSVHWLRNHLEAKILDAIRKLQDAE